MTTPVGSLAVSATPLAGVSEEEWSALLKTNPSASAFSLRAFHQAWWSAHGGGAEDVSLAARSATDGELLGYLPLMRRPDGVIYSGATLHIDYATVLLAPHAGAQSQESDVVADALAAALLARSAPINMMRIRPADDAHVRIVAAIQRAAAVASRTALRQRVSARSIETPALRAYQGSSLGVFMMRSPSGPDVALVSATAFWAEAL